MGPTERESGGGGETLHPYLLNSDPDGTLAPALGYSVHPNHAIHSDHGLEGVRADGAAPGLGRVGRVGGPGLQRATQQSVELLPILHTVDLHET